MKSWRIRLSHSRPPSSMGTLPNRGAVVQTVGPRPSSTPLPIRPQFTFISLQTVHLTLLHLPFQFRSLPPTPGPAILVFVIYLDPLDSVWIPRRNPLPTGGGCNRMTLCYSSPFSLSFALVFGAMLSLAAMRVRETLRRFGCARLASSHRLPLALSPSSVLVFAFVHTVDTPFPLPHTHPRRVSKES